MSAAVQTCSAKLRLFFKGENLADKDILSKSDPYVVLYNARGGHRGVEVGRTETKKDDLNPSWETSIAVDYFFEIKQQYILVVYDHDGKTDAENDVLGTLPFQLSQVMGSRGSALKKPLDKDGKQFIHISAVEHGANGRDYLNFTLAAGKLKKMDTFGLSDPYFKFHRLLPGGGKKLLHKSEVIKKSLDPKWIAVPRFYLEQLTGANLDAKTINIELYDSDLFSDDYMGEVTVSVNELLASVNGHPIMIGKAHKPGKTGYGHFFCTSAKLTHRPTFAEFLKSGWQINLAVSVDFTGSNGDPRNPKSLHYMDPVNPNQYVKAIMSVGEILMEYDSDKMVPVYGFGALMQHNNQISHYFHLNMQENPYVHGVQGILDAYGGAFAHVRLAGPTNFAPTILGVTAGARQAPNVYTVLLIITDGEITDPDATIDAIVAADDAPLSIVIVGVGNGCDFEQMTILDGDGTFLRSSTGTTAKRDLVQFVPMRDFVCSPPGALAAEVLREIPDQFVRWAEIANQKPINYVEPAQYQQHHDVNAPAMSQA